MIALPFILGLAVGAAVAARGYRRFERTLAAQEARHIRKVTAAYEHGVRVGILSEQRAQLARESKPLEPFLRMVEIADRVG